MLRVTPTKATEIAERKEQPPKSIGFSGPVYLGRRKRSAGLSRKRSAVMSSLQVFLLRHDAVMTQFFVL